MAKRKRKETRRYTWIPRWGWVLMFLVPLLLSEYMFYRVGRSMNMILFPIAWVGFWYTLMRRDNWRVFRGQEDN